MLDSAGYAGTSGSGVRARIALLGALLALSLPTVGSAFTLTPFTGDASEVEITLTETPEGGIEMVVQVSMGVADIRGIFFDIADDSLLAGLSISGIDVTDVQFGVIDLGNGANLHGGGTPCPCDVGVEIGRPGLRGGSDDYQTTTILIMHETLDLDLSMFSEQAIGVRLTSVGEDFSNRNGSSKLGGVIPVIPEPATGSLAAFGLAILGWKARRRAR